MLTSIRLHKCRGVPCRRELVVYEWEVSVSTEHVTVKLCSLCRRADSDYSYTKNQQDMHFRNCPEDGSVFLHKFGILPLEYTSFLDRKITT